MIALINSLDYLILEFVKIYLSDNYIQAFFNFFTFIGYFGFFWILILILISIKKKDRKFWFFWGISFILVFLIGDVLLKNIVERSRPFILFNDLIIYTIKPDSYSFPSSHASFSGAGFIIISKIKLNVDFKIILFIISLLISISRIILKVHFFSDVIVGYLLGLIIVLFVNFLFHKFKNIKF